ncbi:MAG: hypothetical protein Q7W45_16400 [Bacteroidota bacterium]|nr:hypothetical protein [Bacteroidota bacterium]MDP3145402.1 hypothetical protein [Bacteroidota bacterium]
MEHIFDNRHVLQSFVVKGGCKTSVSPSSKKYINSFEDAQKMFFDNVTDLEYQKIREYLFTETKNKQSYQKTISWCNDVLENTIRNHRAYDHNGTRRVGLRELFMERVALRGSCYAILFLKKHYYNKPAHPKKICYKNAL